MCERRSHPERKEHDPGDHREMQIRVCVSRQGDALLASVSTYTEFVPAFRALLAQNYNDLSAFYAAVGELARLSKPDREARLRALSPGLAP